VFAVLPICVLNYLKYVCSGICVVSMVCSVSVNGSTYGFFKFVVDLGLISESSVNFQFLIDLLLGAYLNKSTELWWPKAEDRYF